jgi:hypothetical protein
LVCQVNGGETNDAAPIDAGRTPECQMPKSKRQMKDAAFSFGIWTLAFGIVFQEIE